MHIIFVTLGNSERKPVKLDVNKFEMRTNPEYFNYTLGRKMSMFTYYRLTTSKAEILFKTRARRIGFFFLSEWGEGQTHPKSREKTTSLNFEIGIRWVGGGVVTK